MVQHQSAHLRIASAIATEILEPLAAEIDREARWPVEGLRALQKELGGLVIPRPLGGMGLGLLELAQTCEVLARECPSTAICFGMHCVGSAVIASKATAGQVHALVEPIARGEHLTTLALSEPGTGSHFYLPRAQLHATPGGYQLQGTKTFVTNGGHADSYVMSTTSAIADVPTLAGQFNCVVVPANAPGLHWKEGWSGFGMRGNSARTVELEGVALGADALLGRPGDQIWYVFNVVAPNFLMAMAGTYLGIAAATLDEVRVHLKERRYAHSGAVLGDAPVVQHRLGTMFANVERTRQLIYRAAQAAETNAPDMLALVCSAKAEVADCVVQVVNDAMTLMGGLAYRDGSKLQRHLRDARAAPVMSPTTDLLRLWAGRALLDAPMLSD